MGRTAALQPAAAGLDLAELPVKADPESGLPAFGTVVVSPAESHEGITSPITSREGATADFTFADKPAVLVALTLVAAAVCVFAVVSMIKHENEASKRIAEG